MRAREVSYILRSPIPMKKTVRKEHACSQFQNKLFEENKCFYGFLTDVARTSLFQAFVVKKNISDAIRPGRIWIEKVSFELSHVYTEKTAFLFRKTESFVTFPHTLKERKTLVYGVRIYELNLSKNLNVTTTFSYTTGVYQGSKIL